MNTRRVVIKNISSLKSYPRQTEFFGAIDDIREDEEINRLAEDIELNGQLTSIEVLPDGTILKGHRRVAALRRLGRLKVKVIVRKDLDDHPEKTEQEFLLDNQLHRQLSTLQLVRCAERLSELAATAGDREHGELTREWIGRKLNKSGRHVDRLRAIASCPMPIQIACERGDISITLAAKIAKASPATQKKIAKAIENEQGSRVLEIVQQSLPQQSRTDKPSSAYDELRKLARNKLDALDSSVGRVPVDTDDIPTLERLCECVNRLIEHGRELAKNRDQS